MQPYITLYDLVPSIYFLFCMEVNTRSLRLNLKEGLEV